MNTASSPRASGVRANALRHSLPDDPVLGVQPLRRAGGHPRRQVLHNDPEDGPRSITAQEFEESYTGVCFGFRQGPEFRRGGSRPRIFRGLRARFGHSGGSLASPLLPRWPARSRLAVPTMIKVFVDDVLIRQNGDWVNGLLIGLTLAAMLQGALVWLQPRLPLPHGRPNSPSSPRRAFSGTWQPADDVFGQRYAGDLAGRVASNNTVAQLLSGELAVNAVNVLAMVFYAAVMLAYDVPLTLVVVAMVFVNLVVLRLAARAREDANRRLLKEQGRIDGTSVNGIQMIETLKANGREGDFLCPLVGHPRQCPGRRPAAGDHQHAVAGRAAVALAAQRRGDSRRRRPAGSRRRPDHRRAGGLPKPGAKLCLTHGRPGAVRRQPAENQGPTSRGWTTC